jgi:anti-sigma factor RsiW
MKFKFEQHCSDASLEKYALGRLADGSLAILEEHLLICEICRGKLDETERYVRAMKAGAARLRQEPARQSRWLVTPVRLWASAAATLCVVVLVLTVRMPLPLPATPVAVSLAAERGLSVTAPAHRILDLTLDARGLRPAAGTRVELADAGGGVVDTQIAKWSSDRIDVRVSRNLPAGMYYVRLYGPDGAGLQREFALQLK